MPEPEICPICGATLVPSKTTFGLLECPSGQEPIETDKPHLRHAYTATAPPVIQGVDQLSGLPCLVVSPATWETMQKNDHLASLLGLIHIRSTAATTYGAEINVTKT